MERKVPNTASINLMDCKGNNLCGGFLSFGMESNSVLLNHIRNPALTLLNAISGVKIACKTIKACAV